MIFKNINDISKYNTINNFRKFTKERNNIFINENENNKNEIKILNIILYKSCLRYRGIDNINTKNSKNFRFNLNRRFINIESLPLVNKNGIYKYKSNNNIIIIEILESEEIKSKFEES